MAKDQEKMFEVPEEMRNFAVKSVAQARKAFDGFISATHRAVDVAQGSTNAMQSNVNDITKKTIAYAEQNVSAALDLAQRLIVSRDPSEIMQYISDYQRSQLSSMQEQARDVGSVMQRGASEAAGHLQRSAAEATATLRNAASETAEAVQNVVVDAAKRKTA